MTSPDEALKKFGMNEKERRIYVSTLELGSASANRISQKSRLNRSTTYDILKAFIDKGFASKVEKEGISHFEVISPKLLIKKLEEKQQALKEVMPQFEVLMQNTIEKPEVKVFEGKEGFRTILDDVLESRKPISVISTSKVFEVMVYEFPHYITERKRRRISARVIQEKSPQTTGLKKKDEQEMRETRAIKNIISESMIWVYDDKLAIVKLVQKELISVMIKDKTISRDYKKIFDFIWATAAKEDPEQKI